MPRTSLREDTETATLQNARLLSTLEPCFRSPVKLGNLLTIFKQQSPIPRRQPSPDSGS